MDDDSLSIYDRQGRSSDSASVSMRVDGEQ